MKEDSGLTRAAGEVEEEVRAAVRDFAGSMDSSIRVVADMSALTRVTAALPLANLPYWEQLIRDEFSMTQRSVVPPKERGWLAKQLFAASRHGKRTEPVRFLTWIDLSSFDGHVRERTLRTLVGPAPNSFFLGVAARRLNDWVPQVRMAARATLRPLAQASNPEHVVDVLCAILPMWTTWGRAEQLDRQTVLELLSIERVAELLKRRLISEPAGPMSTILSQVLRTPVLDNHLVEIANDAVQPAVRARAQRALLFGKAVWVEERHFHWIDVGYCKGRMQNVLGERALTRTLPLMERLESASLDPSSIVRRVAAEALVGEMNGLGSSALPLARRLAADASPKIAERAAFILQRIGFCRNRPVLVRSTDEV
jgi:hypothetical protein